MEDLTLIHCPPNPNPLPIYYGRPNPNPLPIYYGRPNPNLYILLVAWTGRIDWHSVSNSEISVWCLDNDLFSIYMSLI